MGSLVVLRITQEIEEEKKRHKKKMDEVRGKRGKAEKGLRLRW